MADISATIEETEEGTESTEQVQEQQAGGGEGGGSDGAGGSDGSGEAAKKGGTGIFANVRRLLGREKKQKDLAAEVNSLKERLAKAEMENERLSAQLAAVDQALEGVSFVAADAAENPVAAKVERLATNRTAQHLRALSVPAAAAPAATTAAQDGGDFEAELEASRARGGVEHAKFAAANRDKVHAIAKKKWGRN